MVKNGWPEAGILNQVTKQLLTASEHQTRVQRKFHAPGHFPSSATSVGDSSLFVQTLPELQPVLQDGRRQIALQRHRQKHIALCCSDTVPKVHRPVSSATMPPPAWQSDGRRRIAVLKTKLYSTLAGARTLLSIECMPDFDDYSTLADGVVLDVCATSDRLGSFAAEGQGGWL